MLSCKQVTEVCSDELDRPLKIGEKLAMRSHLMMCRGCTQYRRQLWTLREAAQAYARGQAVSGDAEPDAGGKAESP